MPTAIKVYDNDAGEVVSINRHVFALSAREYGVDSYTTDTTENPGYFTDNASRKCYNEQGQAVSVWARWPASASAVVSSTPTAASSRTCPPAITTPAPL